MDDEYTDSAHDASDPYGYRDEDARHLCGGRPVDDDVEPDEQIEIAEYVAEVRRVAA